MTSSYEIGGIFNALQSCKTNVDTADNSQESDILKKENENLLMDLFTVIPKTSSSSDYSNSEVDIDCETSVIGNEADTKIVEVEESIPTKEKEKDSSKKVKPVKKKETPERLERTLFIGNVSINVTKKTLKKIFIEFGEIESLRFRSFVGADLKVPKKVAVIKMEYHAECKSLHAYVVYKNKESISKALTCNGMVVEGLHLRVDTATPAKQNKNRNSLFIGNLPFNIADEDVYKHFKLCGPIDYVRLIRDKPTGVGKGFGYVAFQNPDGVVFGLKLNNSPLNGRAIRVSRCENVDKFNSNKQNRKNNQQFCGLKATTSMKDRVKGRKLQEKKSNALRRIKGKSTSKNKGKNVKHNQKLTKRKM